jgi:hypothetical protein
MEGEVRTPLTPERGGISPELDWSRERAAHAFSHALGFRLGERIEPRRRHAKSGAGMGETTWIFFAAFACFSRTCYSLSLMTISRSDRAMTLSKARATVDLWTGPAAGDRIPPQTPDSLRRAGASNTARALEQALVIVAAAR